MNGCALDSLPQESFFHWVLRIGVKMRTCSEALQASNPGRDRLTSSRKRALLKPGVKPNPAWKPLPTWSSYKNRGYNTESIHKSTWLINPDTSISDQECLNGMRAPTFVSLEAKANSSTKITPFEAYICNRTLASKLRVKQKPTVFLEPLECQPRGHWPSVVQRSHSAPPMKTLLRAFQ